MGGLTGNDTESHDHQETNFLHLSLWLAVVVPLWVIDVTGNILVFICVRSDRALHRPPYFLIAALSLSDVSYPLVGFIPMVYAAFVDTATVCSLRAQFFLMLPAYVSAASSFFHIVILTAERYFSVAFPIVHRNVVTGRRVFIASGVVWLSSVTANVVFFPFSNKGSDVNLSRCSPFSFEFGVMMCVLAVVGLGLLSGLNVDLLIRVRRGTRRRTNMLVQQGGGSGDATSRGEGSASNNVDNAVDTSNPGTASSRPHVRENNESGTPSRAFTAEGNIEKHNGVENVGNNVQHAMDVERASRENVNTASGSRGDGSTRGKHVSDNVPKKSKSGHHANSRVNRIVSIVVCCFILCWLPATVHGFLEVLNYKIEIDYGVFYVFRKLSVAWFTLNGAINPIVYARQNPRFRTAFKRYLGRRRNQVTDD